jgi:Protein phosphatase 2C
MWNLLCESVLGVSHETTGLPCQDHSLGEWVQTDGETVLLLACADGAGSATYAEVGAKIACEALASEVKEALANGLGVSQIDRGTMSGWYRRARGHLTLEADLHSTGIREFACTLLTAVVGEKTAVFSQIGDGAIIFHKGDTYRTAFWPQSGEYLNTTNFLTDEDFEQRMDFLAHPEPVAELSLLTDGLQMLALRYADKSVHGPFFQAMFQALRATDFPSTLQKPLRDFLTSPSVNRRTDDDKTLILATRRMPNDPAQLVQQPEPAR